MAACARVLVLISLIAPAFTAPSAVQHDEPTPSYGSTTPVSTHPILTLAPQPAKRCDNPCGYYGQLCCAENEICYTDANNQAQCGAAPVSPISPTWPIWSSSAYTTITTSTTISTYIVTYTRIQSDIQTVIGTASWQLLPQQPNCCSPPPPAEPPCSYALGETPCGNICCAAGQYCAAVNQCVAVGTFSGIWSYYTTTYVETDLQTLTTTYSSSNGDVIVGAPSRPTSGTVTVSSFTTTNGAPLRPTSDTLVTVMSG